MLSLTVSRCAPMQPVNAVNSKGKSSMKIKVISDSTCDLPPELLQKYDIDIVPLIVVKNSEEFYDGVTIQPSDIFAHVAAGGSLCSTAARSVMVYQEKFAQYANAYDGIIHINIGSGFSSSYQNACIAAQEFDNICVIDSGNLAAGQGLLVLKACELSKKMDSLDEIQKELEAYAARVEASFVLDRLDYMVKGGRCSGAAALGANLLNLKPCIELKDGKMAVVKKYRGHIEKCISTYVKERLEGRNDLDYENIFLIYTDVPDACIQTARNAIMQYAKFANVYETVAGCTISCHCGPGTLGVMMVRK